MKRKLLAGFMAVCLILTLLPATALAAGETIKIGSDEDLVDAIQNQASGQTWEFTEAKEYNAKNTADGSNGTYEYASRNFAFPIYVDNLTIKKADGVGDVTITSSYVATTANWHDQNFITVYGDNLTIDGVNIKANQNTSVKEGGTPWYDNLANKAIEFTAESSNFTLKNMKLIALENEDGQRNSGSIWVGCSDVGTSVIENVEMASFISGVDYSGTLTVSNLTQDYTDFNRANVATDDGYYLCGIRPTSNSNGTLTVTDLTVKVDDTMNLSEQVFSERLPGGSTVELAPGNYDMGSLEISEAVNIEGAGEDETVIVGPVQYAIPMGENGAKTVTIKGVTFKADPDQSTVQGLKFHGVVAGGTATPVGANVTVKDCTFEGWTYGLTVNTYAQNYDVTIDGCTFNTWCAVSACMNGTAEYYATNTVTFTGTNTVAKGGYAVQGFNGSNNYQSFNGYYETVEGYTQDAESNKLGANFTVDATETSVATGYYVTTADELKTAVAAATDGATIIVGEGDYDMGSLELSKAISIQGAGADKSTIRGQVIYGNHAWNGTGNTISWSGVKMVPKDSNNQALCLSSGVTGYTLNVTDCVFDGWKYGVTANAGATENTIHVTGSEFVNTSCATSVKDQNKVATFEAELDGGYAVQYFNTGYSVNGYYPDFSDYAADRDAGEYAPPISVVESGNKMVFDTAELQAALANATAGDTIYLAAGEYELPENKWFTTPVNLKGAGVGETIINGALWLGGGNGTVVSDVETLTVSGITFRNEDGIGCWSNTGLGFTQINGCAITVQDCELDGFQYGVHMNGTNSGTELNFDNVDFKNTFIAISAELEKDGASIGTIQDVTMTDSVFAVQAFGMNESASLENYHYYTVDGYQKAAGENGITSFNNDALTPGVDYESAQTVKGYVLGEGEDLQAAINKIEAGAEGIILLTSDVSLDSALIIEKSVTINGNGHTVKYTGSGLSSGAFITAQGEGDNVTLQNMTIDTDGKVKHGVQFYCVDGGALKNVTVNGGSYTSVIVNGATATITDCVLNPGDSAYANIEYAMGGGVTKIPEITLSNVTGNSGKPLVYADKATATALNAQDGDIVGDATQEQIAAAINEKYLHGAEITLYYAPEEGGGEGTVIPGTQTYTITFDVNGGNALTETTATTNNAGKLSVLPTPTKAGQYTFAGWYTASGMRVTEQTVFTADTTIYAQWNYTGATTGGGSSSSSGDYIVSVSSGKNGSVSVSPSRADKGDTVTITVKPNTGYELDELTVTDKDGDAVSVKYIGANKYTFTMPAGKVTVEATFAQQREALPFVDVAANAYYYDAVAWAVENGVTSGITETTFAPGNPCTRAQTVTFLWRAAGCPTPVTTVNPFTDVKATDYYYNAVLWAVENGITGGTTATTFSPAATCTRAQVVTFLYRYSKDEASTLPMFADVAENDYYYGAVAWAVENGVTTGVTETAFQPGDPCTRGQIVTFLYRYMGE